MDQLAQYAEVQQRLENLIADEHDEIAVLATVAAELHHASETFGWVGFYRVTMAGVLKIGR